MSYRTTGSEDGMEETVSARARSRAIIEEIPSME